MFVGAFAEGGLWTGSLALLSDAARISLQMGDEPLVRYINVHGTRSVVGACLRAVVRRLVHFGPIHAFDHAAHPGTIDETCPLVGGHAPPYDRSQVARSAIGRMHSPSLNMPSGRAAQPSVQ